MVGMYYFFKTFLLFGMFLYTIWCIRNVIIFEQKLMLSPGHICMAFIEKPFDGFCLISWFILFMIGMLNTMNTLRLP